MDAADFTFASRFGHGVAPGAPLLTPREQMARLGVEEPIEADMPSPSLQERLALMADIRRLRGVGNNNAPEVRDAERRRRAVISADLARLMLLPVRSSNGLRERLVAFWADHFTVAARRGELRIVGPQLVEAAIRPNLTSPFLQMLRAAVLHPAMLSYLDQTESVSPNSATAQIRRRRGLNENLARELLELHTLGVEAGYAQADVRALSLLLAGSTVGPNGFLFNPDYAEPGPLRVLDLALEGGAGEQGLARIDAILAHLATRPETARHVARKLAVHFVAPNPPADLIEDLTAVWMATDGDLGRVHAVLVEHPAAASSLGTRIRRPLEHMIASFRALGAEPENRIEAITAPLTQMGQTAFNPAGPDGWSEDEAAWLTPASLAARVSWSFDLAARAVGDRDPRRLLDEVLGPLAGHDLRRVVAAAETRAEGIGLMLVSPAFIRR